MSTDTVQTTEAVDDRQLLADKEDIAWLTSSAICEIVELAKAVRVYVDARDESGEIHFGTRGALAGVEPRGQRVQGEGLQRAVRADRVREGQGMIPFRRA